MKGEKKKGNRTRTQKFIYYGRPFYLIWCAILLINEFILSGILFIRIILIIVIVVYFWLLATIASYGIIRK